MRRLMRNRLLAGFVAVAVALPAVALATHTFSDVPDGTYYTGAVAWAADNGITTGTSATTFSPDDPVTRAQNVTFAYRYDQNIVQPALDDIDTAIDANTTAASTAQTTADAADAPDRVVWVADDGTGDFLLLSAALASIGDRTAATSVVVRIAPGVYTETSPVALKDHVDVEGSGEGVTIITCACGYASGSALAATVYAYDIVAEIRHLTINNTGGSTYSFGVYTEDVADGSVSMLHVTTTATGAGPYYYGVYNYYSSPSMTNVTASASGGISNYGVYNNYSSPAMTNVTASATGGTSTFGVYNYASSPSMTDVTASATGGTTSVHGVRNFSSSSPSIRNSSITGDDYSISNSSSTALVADTMLDGPVLVGDGLTCVGAYDETFVALDEACAVIP